MITARLGQIDYISEVVYKKSTTCSFCFMCTPTVVHRLDVRIASSSSISQEEQKQCWLGHQNGRQQQQQLRRQEGQQHQHQPGRIAASAPAQQQCWLWHQNGRHPQRLLWRQEGQPPQRRLDSSILSVGCGGGMDSSRSVGCGARRDSNISVGAAVCGARRYISISSVGCGGRMDSSRIVGCGTRRDSNISVTATLASTQQCAALGGTAASASAQQCWMWRQNGQQQQCQPGGTVVAVSNRENSSIASSHIVMKSNLVWILMRLCRTFITR